MQRMIGKRVDDAHVVTALDMDFCYFSPSVVVDGAVAVKLAWFFVFYERWKNFEID